MSTVSRNSNAVGAIGTAGARSLDLTDSIRRFAGSNGDYYAARFRKIQSTSKLTWSFNWAAVLLGPIWAGGRGLWGLFCFLAIVELFVLVPLSQGLWGDLGAEPQAKMERLQKNQARVFGKMEAAQKEGKEKKAAKMAAIAKNLGKAIERVKDEIEEAKSATTQLIVWSVAGLILVKVIAGWSANYVYERRYSRWRVDRHTPGGFSWLGAGAAGAVLAAVYGVTIYRYTAAVPPEFLLDFPMKRPDLHDPVADRIDHLFDYLLEAFAAFFESIAIGIRVILDGLETLLLDTPWPVVMILIVVTAWRVAGARVAIFTIASLTYIAYFGFWERSMETIALLGAAAFLCIAMGIPLGVWFARSDRVYAIGRPILDSFQTMPAFVFLIPVIAFFGTGKAPGVIAAITFGIAPIVRLTNLGIRQVPADVREAAQAFGATRWQILKGVEAPLALPSILIGVNQTILFCLSAVVIASLIGAQGLGFDILNALQYAAKGQSVLAGFAILFCAMVIDRVVQGRFKG